jgi:MFS family permease
VVWVAIGIGSPLLGWISNRFRNRRAPLIACSLFGLFGFSLFLFLNTPPFWLLGILLFIFGFSATSQVITFGLVLDNQKDDVLGTAIGFNNMAVIAGGIVLPYLVGWISTDLWKKNPTYSSLHVPLYTFHQYQIALLVIPICFIIGLLIALFGIKETHTQRVGS